jgi:hypothetical protein
MVLVHGFGVVLGSSFIEPPSLLPGDPIAPYPFDPFQDGATSAGRCCFFEIFRVGLGIPFSLLGRAMRKGRRAGSAVGKGGAGRGNPRNSGLPRPASRFLFLEAYFFIPRVYAHQRP